jgi:hypothetical protein
MQFELQNQNKIVMKKLLSFLINFVLNIVLKIKLEDQNE